MRVLKFYGYYFSKYKWSFALVVFLIVLATYLQVKAPVYLGEVVAKLADWAMAYRGAGEAMNSQSTMPKLTDFNALMLKLLLAYLISSIIIFSYSRLFSRLISFITNQVRKDLFNKVGTLTIDFFDSHKDGEILSHFTSDLDNIQRALSQSFIQFLRNIALYIGLIWIMFAENSQLALLTIATTPLALLFLVFIAKSVRRYTGQQQEEVSQLNAYMDEKISGQKVIIVQGLQQETIAKFIDHNGRVRKAGYKGHLFSGLLLPLMNGLSLLNTAIVIFGGSVIVLNQQSLSKAIALGLIVTFVQYSQQYYQPILQISASWGEIELALTGAARIQKILELPEEDYLPHQEEFKELRYGITIEKLGFAYPSAKKVLSDISIKVNKGEMVAVVGPTGSGKTTITNLINRFYDPDRGKITFDGRDISEYGLSSLRQQIGTVFQESVLFAGTIAENIKFGNPEASLEMVESAARAVKLHCFITGLPDKYETMISNDSNVFSTGQKQLISIARTLLSDPQILILDEATSNVDTVTESKLQSAIEMITSGRTSFVIAHRLKTILNADKIIVLKEGKVIEEGRYGDLLQRKGFYAELYRNQFVLE
ncbi:ABC transporter ATP-binding protein [Streptococcus mutans]|uniref:ABC transporter ATP-binding protein n=1 Tax=Streptococcus mutans TaxID=1309 RepID=UPI0029888FB0|nr:ABC transporter ATP-binding protein [Streptococcus mutans]MDW5565723.1 ABC transporter ATP-binding protein [Streptococcus mutans]